MLYTNDRFQKKEEQKVCKRSVIVSARCIAESFQRSSKAQDGSAAPESVPVHFCPAMPSCRGAEEVDGTAQRQLKELGLEVDDSRGKEGAKSSGLGWK